MLSPKQWLCAAALLTLPGFFVETRAANGDTASSPEKNKVENELLASADKTYGKDGLTILEKNAKLEFDNINLRADLIKINSETGEVTVPGEAAVILPAVRILAMDTHAQLNQNREPALNTGEFRMGSPPGYLTGGSIKTTLKNQPDGGSVTTAHLNEVTIFYSEPDFFSISVDASKISYVITKKADEPFNPDDSEIRVEDAVVRVAGIPVFYIPSYSQRGVMLPPFQPYVRMGYKKLPGIFLRTTTYYTAWKDYQPGLLLDGNTKAGVLIGPAFRYDNTGDVLESVMKGDFQAGWIKDRSDRGTDNYDNPISSDRWFVIWDHKQKFSNNLELTSSLNYWSDTSVLRDFRSHLFDKNQQPDSFVELVYPDNYFYASVFARYRPNDYQDVVQRLPEVRYDLNPSEIFNTGIYQRLNVAFAFLEERASPENPFLPGGGAELESPRLDAYYGWTRPVKVSDWLTVTPVAGVRSSTYFDANGSDNTYTRVLPQLGFDFQLLAQGQWDYKNEFWGINGLRHQIRPVVQYRWIPAADKGASKIPSIDRYAFTPYPPPIDLSQKRYADDLWEQQVLRVGFENLFQTRADGYGSRDLAWLNIYQDFRDTNRAGARTLSNTYTHLGISPTYWLTLEIYNRLDPYNWDTTEFSSRVTVHDGDRWRVWFGTQYITDVNQTTQYYWGGEYQINSEYSIRAQWRYDSEVSKLTEQFYGLRQRLGHTWTIEYVLGYRENAREDSDFSFGVNLRMETF